jgi:hypothetical protein
MDINILVGPAYERQRTQSTGIFEPDVNHILCMPMGIYTPGHESLYAGMPSLDMLHYQQANHQLQRLLIEASVTPVRSMVSIKSLPFVRQHTFVEPVYGRQRPQPIDVSEPRCQTL